MATTEEKTLSSKSMTPSLNLCELADRIKLALTRASTRVGSELPEWKRAQPRPADWPTHIRAPKEVDQ